MTNHSFQQLRLFVAVLLRPGELPSITIRIELVLSHSEGMTYLLRVIYTSSEPVFFLNAFASL